MLKISTENHPNLCNSSDSFFDRFSDPKTGPKSIKNRAVDLQGEPCWSRRLRKGCRSSQTFSKLALTATPNASETPQNSSRKSQNRSNLVLIQICEQYKRAHHLSRFFTKTTCVNLLQLRDRTTDKLKNTAFYDDFVCFATCTRFN